MWNLEVNWNNTLIQSISIQDTPCSEGYSLFEVVWLGSRPKLYTVEEECKSCEDGYRKVVKVNILPLLHMRKLGDKYICYNQEKGLDHFRYSDQLELDDM